MSRIDFNSITTSQSSGAPIIAHSRRCIICNAQKEFTLSETDGEGMHDQMCRMYFEDNFTPDMIARSLSMDPRTIKKHMEAFGFRVNRFQSARTELESFLEYAGSQMRSMKITVGAYVRGMELLGKLNHEFELGDAGALLTMGLENQLREISRNRDPNQLRKQIEEVQRKLGEALAKLDNKQQLTTSVVIEEGEVVEDGDTEEGTGNQG